MHVGILFCKHSKVSMMHCRKCNYVLANVEVEILLTFLESTKVKVRLYQQYVSVFLCLHVKSLAFFKYLILKYPLQFVIGYKVVRFAGNPH